MNIAAIVIGASFAKTENSPFESRMPRNTKVHAPMIATTGRHDPCVGIRAVPVVEAMMALVLADQMLHHRGQCG